MEFLPFISDYLGRFDRLIYVFDSLHEIKHTGKLLSRCFEDFVIHEKFIIQGQNDDSLLEGCNEKIQERLEEITNIIRQIMLKKESKSLRQLDIEKYNVIEKLKIDLLIFKTDIKSSLLRNVHKKDEIQILCQNEPSIEVSNLTVRCNILNSGIDFDEPPVKFLQHEKTCNKDDHLDNFTETLSYILSKEFEDESKSTMKKSTDVYLVGFHSLRVFDHRQVYQKLKNMSYSSKMATFVFWEIWVKQYV